MRLAADDISVELRIAGYQFPAEKNAEYDSNWLMIEGVVMHPRGNWRFFDPSLLTYEVSQLADWLDAVEKKQNSNALCVFIEPNLKFEVLTSTGSSVLRVSFGVESRPPWVEWGEEGHIDFPMCQLDLAAAATLLRQQLSQYPQRAER